MSGGCLCHEARRYCPVLTHLSVCQLYSQVNVFMALSPVNERCECHCCFLFFLYSFVLTKYCVGRTMTEASVQHASWSEKLQIPRIFCERARSTAVSVVGMTCARSGDRAVGRPDWLLVTIDGSGSRWLNRSTAVSSLSSSRWWTAMQTDELVSCAKSDLLRCCGTFRVLVGVTGSVAALKLPLLVTQLLQLPGVSCFHLFI